MRKLTVGRAVFLGGITLVLWGREPLSAQAATDSANKDSTPNTQTCSEPGSKASRADVGKTCIVSSEPDYAVPESPALAMLDVDESKILRPASAKALTAALSSASGDFSFIPRSFGIEFAPVWMLKRNDISLKSYTANHVWLTMRVSIAAKRDTGSHPRSEVAAAIRLSIIDGSDLRLDTGVVKGAILNSTRLSIDSTIQVQQECATRACGGPGPKQDSVEKRVAVEMAAKRKAANEALAAAKKATEEQRWNHEALDVAVGARASSADSVGKSTRYDGTAAWLTYGFPVFGQWGQVLLSSRGAYERDTSVVASALEATGDGIVRLYAGTVSARGFVEFQATGRKSAKPQWLGDVGGEFGLGSSTWFSASIGLQADGAVRNAHIVTAFKIKLSPD